MLQPSFITGIHWEYQALVQFYQIDTFFFVSHGKFLGRLKGRLGWIWLTEVDMRIPASLTIIQYKLTTNFSQVITNIIVVTGQQDSVQFSSVAQSRPTLCDHMNRSMPGFPVHHLLPEYTQTHVH